MSVGKVSQLLEISQRLDYANGPRGAKVPRLHIEQVGNNNNSSSHSFKSNSLVECNSDSDIQSDQHVI